MGLTICKCFADACQSGCAPTGFALIRARAPEDCPPTTLYDVDTGMSYPWNWETIAPIDENGCWTSCELPFSDRMHPNVTYQIVDIIAGSCGDDCGCDAAAACNCPVPCNDELPVCEIWISSEADYPVDENGCVNAGLLCADGAPPPTALPCKNPKCIGVPFVDLCLQDADDGGLGVWYAPGLGVMTIQAVSIPVGVTPSASDINFEMLKYPGGTTVATGTLPAGESVVLLDEEFSVEAGCGIAMKIIEPAPEDMTGALSVQTEFAYCPEA